MGTAKHRRWIVALAVPWPAASPRPVPSAAKTINVSWHQHHRR